MRRSAAGVAAVAVIAVLTAASSPPGFDPGSARDPLANAMNLTLDARSYRAETDHWGRLETVEDWDSGRVHERDANGEYEQRTVGPDVFDSVVCHLGDDHFDAYFISRDAHTPIATEAGLEALEMVMHASTVREVPAARGERYVVARHPATAFARTTNYSDIEFVVRDSRVRSLSYTTHTTDSEPATHVIRFTRFGTAPKVIAPPADQVMHLHDCNWYEDRADPPVP